MKTPKQVLAHKLPSFLAYFWSADGVADVLLDGLEAAGYAVVPVEPTNEMRIAGTKALLRHNSYAAVWGDMIAAAKGET